jgi:hypothetical protein
MTDQTYQTSTQDEIDLGHAEQDAGQSDSEFFVAAGQYTVARCRNGGTVSRCKHALRRCKH